MRYAGILFMIALVALTGCKKCRKENPRARIVNNGTEVVSVHIMTSGGNTVNINNIGPGTVSSYSSYEEGVVEFTVTIGNGGSTVTKYITVTMGTCFEYDIVIDSNNNLVSVPRDRNG